MTRPQARRVAVIGAGVVGVATAFLLCRDGHEVTLIDRNAAPGRGESFANGAQLSYSYCDALGTPSLLRHMPEILLGRDPAYRFRLRADPDFLIWGLRFLANCAPGRALANTRHLLAMAEETRRLMREVAEIPEIEFGHATAGKMILHPTAENFEKSRAMLEMKRAAGLKMEALSRDEATAVEPALAQYRDEIARVTYSPEDEVGLPDRFCESLVAHLQARYGLKTRFGQEARRLLVREGRVCGVVLARSEPVESEAVVLAVGNDRAILPLRDRLWGDLRPVQGYSLTRPAAAGSLKTSVTDVKRKTVFAPVGGLIRIAGLADFGAGRGGRIACEPDRLETLKSTAAEAFSGEAAGDLSAPLETWSGARPCAPSSRPMIRRGALKGLYLNLGHGALGWTLCLGSAAALREVMAAEA